ncbi:unnamed protein product [Brugia timori]|uniref:Sensor histidine kinase n=1 Tax=Brugia timori TaxID=42155 RepID=A0A0R3QK24_9BILA|nr:unnamed protein product [Brugia timori]
MTTFFRDLDLMAQSREILLGYDRLILYQLSYQIRLM